MLSLIGISLFAVGIVDGPSPIISGNWRAARLSHHAHARTAPGEYTGTYTDTVREEGPGTIALKWSQIEGRFNGTWHKGEDDRFAKISIHLVGQEIRGGLTTSEKFEDHPATRAQRFALDARDTCGSPRTRERSHNAQKSPRPRCGYEHRRAPRRAVGRQVGAIHVELIGVVESPGPRGLGWLGHEMSPPFQMVRSSFRHRQWEEDRV